MRIQQSAHILSTLLISLLLNACAGSTSQPASSSQNTNNPVSGIITEPTPVSPPDLTPPVINTGPELVSLKVTESSGVDQPNSQIRSGVPFPKGRLLSSDDVELYSNDILLPTQVRPISKWNDGSIRWLLVDSVVPLTANETKILELKKVNNLTPVNGIEIQQSAEFITVDTGPLTVQIPKLYGGIIHTASINGTPVINAPSVPTTDRGAYITVFDSTDNSTIDYYGGLLESNSSPLASDPIKDYMDRVNSSGDSNYNLYSPFNLEVVVEEDAPLHSVIRISGAHLNNAGLGFSTFIVRLHFYKNQSSIKVAHSMVYTGDETQQVASFGLKLPMLETGSSTLIEGTTPTSGLGEVRHLNYRNFEVNGNSTSGQAIGYIGRSKDNVNMSVVLRDMAEHFPKALLATSNGLEVQLYPESTSPWNLTKYTPEAGESDFTSGNGAEIATKVGETTSFTNHYFLRGAQGLSTSDDYIISFATGTLDQPALEDLGTAIERGPLMLVAPASWYSDSRVMGVGAFAFEHDQNTAEGHYRIDKVLQVAQEFMRVAQRKEFDWFGIENYGDIRGRFHGSRDSNGEYAFNERGRYGWSGNSGEPSNQLWIQYLRKPDQQAFLDAEALARHTLDQQTVHFATSSGESGTELDGRNMLNSVGSLHRHGVQAWSGYAGSPDYSHVAGVETYYYLTGDERAKEVLYEQAQFIARQSSDRTSIKNGLDVIDRAAAVFFDNSTIHTEFENKAVDYVNYLKSSPGNTGYNVVQTRLIDRKNEDGVHDSVNYSNEVLYDRSFEYFVRGARGIMYRHERTGDTSAAQLIIDAANILTVGDPKNPTGDGDDWDIGLDGHAGNTFFHINSLAYAAAIAPSLNIDGTAYYNLAKKSVEFNNHGIDAPAVDTSYIPLDMMNAFPDDWTMWDWKYTQPDQFGPGNLGILWIDRQIMYRNDYLQDYHSYRALQHLATGAAIIEQGYMQLR